MLEWKLTPNLVKFWYVVFFYIMPVAGKSAIATLEGASEQNRFTCSGNIFDRFTG